MLPTIRIFTLGTLQVVRGDHLVTEGDWHTRQARQLLKILVTERPRPVSTDRLIELLWSQSTPDAAATTLRSAINALRNVLEPDRPNRAPSRYIVTQNPGYAFHPHPEIWLDVDIFEQRLTQAQSTQEGALRRQLLEEAVALYQDDYLISDPYADWAEAERERLRERYFSALLSLAELQAMAGEHTTAIGNARKILARDEVRENAWQAVMRYQAESGDSAGALLTFERCRTILADELGADPSPLTQLWHQRILNGEITPREPAQESVASLRKADLQPMAAVELPQQVIMPSVDVRTLDLLVGREAEIAGMQKALGDALDGHGSMLMLEGEAGVGKTRLAVALLQQAADRGATVISATCQAIERDLPFAALADVVGRYLQEVPDGALFQLPRASLQQVTQIVPSLQDRLTLAAASASESSESLEENRLRLVDGIVDFLIALARAKPLVLFLDDLHWADADTLTLVNRLARRLEGVALLLLIAWRSDDLPENDSLAALLRTLRSKGAGVGVHLPRFNRAEVQAMTESLLKRPDMQQSWTHDDLAGLLHDLTRGNPLYVSELLRDLLERQGEEDVRTAAGETPLVAAARELFASHRNRRVQELILERMERLPDEALWVLQLSAVIARDYSLELLELAAASDPLVGLEVLLERNFLIERPDQRLDFHHHIVRQVAYESMSALQRRRWHLRVAEGLVVLGRAEQNPAEAAFHFGQAGAQGAFRYARFAILAGEKLLRAYGFHQAIDYFDNAMIALERLPVGALSANHAANHGANQEDSEESTGRWMERALQGRALAFESLFDLAGATDSWQRIVALARRHNDPNLLLRVHSRMATVLGLMGQARESHKLLQDLVLILAPDEGDEARLESQVMVDLLARRNLIYEPAEENAASDEWASYTPPPPPVADPLGDLLRVLEPVHAVLPLFDYGWTLLVQGQLGEATRSLSTVVDLAIETVQPSLASTALHQLAATARILGEYDQSQALNERSVALNREVMGTASTLASLWPRIASALLSLNSGKVEEAEGRLQRVLVSLGDGNNYSNYRNSANIGMGLVALARGDLERGETLFVDALDDPSNLYPYMRVQAWHGLARIARVRGDNARADDLLRTALRFAGRRSLLEEYIETVLEIARQRPAGAPINRLIDDLVEYIRPIHFTAAIARLEAVRVPVSTLEIVLEK